MAQFGGDQFVIVICTLTSIYTFILTPLSLYYLHLLWRLSSEHIPFFTKRHPKLILVSAILFNIYPTVLRPIADLTRAYSIFPIDHPLPRSIVNIMQWYVVLDYMRLWLLYYDYNYSLHSLKLKWKEHILKTEMNIPWTHKYKFMGNLKTLSIISIPIGIIFVLIVVGGEILFGAKVLILLQVVPMICTLFALVIAVKVRKCRDDFMIQKEMQIYGIALILVIMSYMAIQLASTSGTNLRLILMNMFTCFCCYFMSFVSTHWVLKQYHLYEKHLLEFKLFDETENEVRVRLTLEEILSTKIGFDIFANHLVKEFSIENLFYIFSLVQIKNQLILHKLIEEKDVGIMFPIDFHRMDTLTRKDSYIYTFEEMKKNIEYIISQYIDMDAPYAINISSNMRNMLKKSYGELHNTKLQITEMKQWEEIWNNETKVNNVSELIKKYMKIFDESMEEIIALMRHDSLTRFYSTKEYQAFVNK